MLDMATRRSRRRPEFPDWLRERRGFDAVAGALPVNPDTGEIEEAEPYVGDGPWEFRLSLPANLREVAENEVDPLILLAMMSFGVAQAEDGIAVLVRLCRDMGASWTQIGDVLGMSKQAAWERFSGEE